MSYLEAPETFDLVTFIIILILKTNLLSLRYWSLHWLNGPLQRQTQALEFNIR